MTSTFRFCWWNKNPTETFLCSCQDCFFCYAEMRVSWHQPGYHFYFMSFAICMLHFSKRIFFLPLLAGAMSNAYCGDEYNGEVIIIEDFPLLFNSTTCNEACNSIRLTHHEWTKNTSREFLMKYFQFLFNSDCKHVESQMWVSDSTYEHESALLSM